MTKIRRGGYVFLAWKGDHSPRHVHIYRQGRLVLKWDLENGKPMAGGSSRRLLAMIRELESEGSVVKIRSVRKNNRKHAFEISTWRGLYLFPYSKADPAPFAADAVKEVIVDNELGGEAFTYLLESGREGSVHLEQVLEYNRDPRYMRDLLLYRLTLEAQRRVDASPLSKREIIRRLGTSPAQFYRLIDQTNYRKSVDKLLSLLAILDCDVDLVVRARGA